MNDVSDNIPSPPLSIPICLDNISVSSISSIESTNESNLPAAPSKARGRPSGTSNNNRRKSTEILCSTNEKAARLWKECRDKGENKPGWLKKIIDSISSEFNLDPNLIMREIIILRYLVGRVIL